MYQNKIDAIFDCINQNDVDGLILVTSINTKWFLNQFYNDFCLIVATNDMIHCFLDGRDIDVAKQLQNKNVQVHLFKSEKDWIKFVRKLKLKRVLIDETYTTLSSFNKYIEPIKLDEPIYFDGANLRMVKSEQEIEHIQKACDIVCDGINYIKSVIQIGMTEKEVADLLAKRMFANGATGLSFPTIVSFGKNSANIHSTPTDKKLEKNEMILIDAGCVYEDYCSDITRCWWIGKPSKDMQRIYKIVLKANIVGIKNAKAYMFGSELDYKVRESVKYALTGYDYPHGTGHGVGCLVHENPRVNKIYDKPLLENSIVTIEPGIYLNNKFGVRIEDTIVITKNGCKVLTDKSSKDLVV